MNEGLKIIWLKTGPLHPLDTGGKIRTCNMLRALKRKNHVTYLALCPLGTPDDVLKSAAEYSTDQIWIPWQEARKFSAKFAVELAQNFFCSRRPYVISKYQSAEMARKIQELDAAGKHDLIICDFLTPTVNLFADNWRPKAPVLLFQHNVESLIWKRLFDKATGLKRFYFRGQWNRMAAYEKLSCERCDGVVAVSEEDAQLMRSEFHLKNLLGAVPTGVDVDYFTPKTVVTKTPRSLVFLGSMDWMPNIDAVIFFMEEIFPPLKAKFPDVTFTVVGRNPPARIKEFGQMPGINITGTVADVRPHLASADVMIVPLRIGGGTRIKIYEGMAAGLPVVSTRVGAEGLPLTHGENIALADEPTQFAKEIGNLFEQAALREKIGRNGLALVRECFGWEAATDIFEDYCRNVCSPKAG